MHKVPGGPGATKQHVDVWSRWVLYGCVMVGTCGLPLPPLQRLGFSGGMGGDVADPMSNGPATKLRRAQTW